jgi:hypothetical protein
VISPKLTGQVSASLPHSLYFIVIYFMYLHCSQKEEESGKVSSTQILWKFHVVLLIFYWTDVATLNYQGK